MTDIEKLEAINSAIDFMYSQAAVRPQMQCSPASSESFLSALEIILCIIDPERGDSYQGYLSEQGFGMHYYESKFQKDEDCVHTFVRRSKDTDENDELLDTYIESFKRHWQNFLSWREQQRAV